MKLACRSAALSANAFLSDLHAFVMPKLVYRSQKTFFQAENCFCVVRWQLMSLKLDFWTYKSMCLVYKLQVIAKNWFKIFVRFAPFSCKKWKSLLRNAECQMKFPLPTPKCGKVISKIQENSFIKYKIVFIQWSVPNEISRKRFHEAKSISMPGGGHGAMKVIFEKNPKIRQKVEKCKINFELCRNHFQRALKSFSVVTENDFQAPKITFDDPKTFLGPKNVFHFLFQRGGYFPDVRRECGDSNAQPSTPKVGTLSIELRQTKFKQKLIFSVSILFAQSMTVRLFAARSMAFCTNKT